jgi:hypothetical protein
MRVAFAGLSPLCERIVTEALSRAGDFEVVEPWTSLDALRRQTPREDSENVLFIELAGVRLPGALRAMLASATRLKIIALSMDATCATVYELREHRTEMLRFVADDICAALAASAQRDRATTA